ncbi:family 43 glycosylhydrolase [Phaeodactylibacter xiamenensis]|uniref:family 43 glycosylhydrolase n=1 Tax=Phaeodactylibacter xiamenensis TaxID=1524460 RepID=UPI0024A9C4E7|nr:family 43 glycosylhydrolase [Phaeodactylibacter xiamenensis]
MLRFLTSLFIAFIVVSMLKAQNPISPPGLYLADPSARIFQDGRLYLYASQDESCDYYCSRRHSLLSTTDMKSWQVHPDVFHSEGPKDEVPGSDALLFAPDAAFIDGKYHLYYCMPDPSYSEGVAVGDSPGGPFRNGQSIDLGGYNQIDPAVFTDDDGQVYYLWGQFTLKMARLNPDGKSLDLSTIQDSILTESRHYFHEGAYLTKRNGLYYLVYADISRADKPTCVGYAVSESPMGPYTYGGVIVDNRQCNPGNWNNHGSIAEFNGQWYVFYHRSTHGCNKMRKACVEPIDFTSDGHIPEVPMTTQGALPPLPARDTLSAARACLLFGDVRVVQSGGQSEVLSGFGNGDKAAFKYIKFDTELKRATIRLKQGQKGGQIRLRLDQPWHQEIARFNLPEGQPGWQTLSVDLSSIPKGERTLWFLVYGEGAVEVIDWVVFE